METARESSTIELVNVVWADVQRKVEAKDDAYGQAWRKRGWRANLARVFSKADRLENLLWRTEIPIVGGTTDETVEDTVLDMMALLAFFLINYRYGDEWRPGSGE